MDEEPILNLYRVRMPQSGSDIETGPHYCEFIVCCENEQEARETHPGGNWHYSSRKQAWCSRNEDLCLTGYEHWVKPTDKDINNIPVVQIGVACGEEIWRRRVFCAIHS